MRTASFAMLAAAAMLTGCCGPYARPEDSFLRPGVSLNAYRNIVVAPVTGNDIDGVHLIVSNELASAGFRVVDIQDFKSFEETEKLATLFCYVTRNYYPTQYVALEFQDVGNRKVFSSRAQGEMYGQMPAIAKLAASYVKRYYTGFDESALMAPYEQGEVIKLSRDEFREYLDARGTGLDPLEGIWSEDSYTYEVGIMRDTLSGSQRDFVAFVLSTTAATWKPGQVKAEFTLTSNSGVFRTAYYLRDHSKQSSVATLEGCQFALTLKDYVKDTTFLTIFTRTYPATPNGTGVSSKPSEARGDVPSVGTGFLVSSDGTVATNFHVVDGIEAIEVYFPSRDVAFDATVMFKDKLNDIVLLKLKGFTLSKLTSEGIPYGIDGAGDVGLGGDVYTLGFPLSVVLGPSIKMSNGTISSLSGIDDDPRVFQISSPVQPGNSGGPLFNKDGNVVGIVVSSLSAKYFYERASVIPQNVNFAVKADYLRSLLAMSPGGKDALGRAGQLRGKSVEEQVKLISPFIAAIRAR
jgi:S1-C subfamily serine protease